MQVIQFHRDHCTRLAVGDAGYFVLENQGQTLAVPDKCPHRGGPLHLGQLSDCSRKLVCPWHDTAFPIASLAKRALPTLRSGQRLTVLAPPGAVKLWREPLPHL